MKIIEYAISWNSQVDVFKKLKEKENTEYYEQYKNYTYNIGQHIFCAEKNILIFSFYRCSKLIKPREEIYNLSVMPNEKITNKIEKEVIQNAGRRYHYIYAFDFNNYKAYVLNSSNDHTKLEDVVASFVGTRIKFADLVASNDMEKIIELSRITIENRNCNQRKFSLFAGAEALANYIDKDTNFAGFENMGLFFEYPTAKKVKLARITEMISEDVVITAEAEIDGQKVSIINDEIRKRHIVDEITEITDENIMDVMKELKSLCLKCRSDVKE